jgi:hypothetical protein
MPWSLPAIVLIIVSAAHAPATSLAQVALNESLRRLLTPPSTWHVSTIDIPPPFPSAADVSGGDKSADADSTKKTADSVAGDKNASAAAKDAKDKEEVGDEAAWRARMAAARTSLERDQVLLNAVQSQINALMTDFVNRDDPAQRAEIERQRVRALAELDRLKKQVQTDTDDIAAIEEDARKKGIPPGWIR